jgi:exonuclease SbcC
MKILAIRVKNLASLEGVFEIDFSKEPLKSAGIFAITGPTGAGKSTLLDAVCLALFSKTPRHVDARESGIELQDGSNNKINQGDIRSILRKGSTDGYAEVEFIGIDGRAYKSVWSVRRARNRADGSLQSDSITLTTLDTNTIFPEKKTETLNEISRLVGLNYEQFTRSVLLAQGDFTAFLKADKDEKSSLLEKLTGTDIYSEISKRIYEKTKKAELELSSLRKQMEGITLLTDEELLPLNEQKEILKKKISDLKVESDKIVDEINWYTALNNLVLDKDKAETEWNLSRKEKEDAAERIKNFVLIESIQGAKSLIEFRDSVKRLLQQKSGELNILVVNVKELNDKLIVANSNLTNADNDLIKKENDYKNALPDIDKAKKTDTLIAVKKDQIGIATNENEAAKTKQKDHLSLLLSKEKEINTLAKEIEELTKWKNNNISNKKIAENITLILSKLTDADKFMAQQKAFLTEIEQVNLKIKKSGNDIEILEKSIGIKAKALEELSASFQLQTKQLEAIPIADIKDKLNVLSKSREDTVIAKGCWELLFASKQEYGKIQTKVTGIKETLSSKTEELGLVNNSLQTASIKKEQTEKLLSKATLETAENVELMRSQLIEGEPCPVCGSEHHTYTKDNKTLHTILDGLNLEFKTCVEQYEQLLKTQSSLNQLCKSLEKEKVTTEAEVSSISEAIKIRNQKWQACNPNKKCLELPDNERLAWFETEMTDIKINIIDIQNQIDNYDQLKIAIDQKKTDVDKFTNELSVFKQSLKDIQRDRQTYSEELTRLENELNACKISISEITNTLAPNFNNPGWKDNWEKEPVVFKERLKSFTEEWNKTIKLLDTSINKQGVLETEFKGLNKQKENFEASVKTTEDKLAELLGNHNSLLEERKMLFNGDEITLVEKRFKKTIEDAQTALTLCKSEKDKIDDEIIKTNGSIEQLNQDISSFNLKLEEHSSQIREWLSNYNVKNQNQLTEEILVQLLAHTAEWIAEERSFISNLDQTLTRTKATFEERKLQLEAHLQKKLSDRTLEVLQTSQIEVNENINSSGNEKNEIEFRLRQDAENKKQASSFLSEINTKQSSFANWQKLNELIGSADGKKFRQIAQEYTLDILLGFANIHLQLLAKRYKLARIPDTLALQVLDKDMGDEIRSVHSLSGGESFLVSLALALALASLSTNKMKVESLFIDEGFGSLDPATLNIAMDALECLHNQGRKVGVISHVQEMTERIPTQIKVSKLSNGKSKLEIIGAII